MDDLASEDFGGNTRPHRALEEVSKPLGAPTLPNARQRGVVRQRLVQVIAEVPSDAEAVRGHSGELPLGADALEEHDQLQLEEHDRVNTRAAERRIAVGHQVAHEAEGGTCQPS